MNSSTGIATRTPGTERIGPSRLMGSPSMMRLRRLCTMSRSARAASTACCTPVFRPCSTPKSAKATLTWRKMRMVRPGLRQMPDQMSGRNFMRRSVPEPRGER